MRSKQLRLSPERYQRNRRAHLAARFAFHPRPAVGTTGVHHPLAPYAGPKAFDVRGPSAQPGDRAFLVVRDERLFLPYRGFRVFYQEHEVGRNLSYPDYDCCQRLRREHAAVRQGLGAAHG